MRGEARRDIDGEGDIDLARIESTAVPMQRAIAAVGQLGGKKMRAYNTRRLVRTRIREESCVKE